MWLISELIARPQKKPGANASGSAVAVPFCVLTARLAAAQAGAAEKLECEAVQTR